MNLIPIVYTSLLIVSGLLVVVLTVSYILSKLKRNNIKPYELATASSGYNNSQAQYKRTIVLDDNGRMDSSPNIVYRRTEPKVIGTYREERTISSNKPHSNGSHSTRYSRVHTNGFDYEDSSGYNNYYRRKPIQYTENNIYKYYSEI